MSTSSRARERQRRLVASVASGYPRNPTASQRVKGAPRLSPLEYETLRIWQHAQIARYVDTPEAVAQRVVTESLVEIPFESIVLINSPYPFGEDP
jgi:hypothetical protein